MVCDLDKCVCVGLSIATDWLETGSRSGLTHQQHHHQSVLAIDQTIFDKELQKKGLVSICEL